MKLHYYGDIVRRLFIAGAVVMIVSLPFVISMLPVPLYVSIIAITLLGVFAGLTNPNQRWVAILDVVISTLSVIMFVYFSVDAYGKYGADTLLFWSDLILSVLFFLALYYSMKTLRGMIVSK